MRILRMTMSHSQIQKKNNFQPEDQISTVYKNSSFQPEHYFSGRGSFIRKGVPYKQFQPLISDTQKSFHNEIFCFYRLFCMVDAERR